MMNGSRPLELWGGVECTVNRVGDQYFDQLKSNGHDFRIEDLDRFAELGLRTLRYPFLWERIAPQSLNQADWAWADERVARLKELSIRPVAGFIHHGSGPQYTHLLDPEFGEKLRAYAIDFAQRYPWIDDYTPVNEILTTARFSGLYGLWYPHKFTHRDCFQILMNECRATVLAMEAIRKINPKARLIQTDDLGKATSTPLLGYQAEFENERRWLSWDLLCGKINSKHPLWAFLLKNGVSSRDLLWFSDHPCPPDLIGINHYLLSNRYFDEKLERYPVRNHGNNDRHRYADIEAVRVEEAPQISPVEIFLEAWNRYQIPLAVTEVHVNAPREDQIRWFMTIWNSVLGLRKMGVPVEAVTAWGLLGHFDWHCLVTRCEGRYESGVFDLRSPHPRPTALAFMISELSKRGTFEHATLGLPGWWERDLRICYPTEERPLETEGSAADYPNAIDYSQVTSVPRGPVRPILIAGASGTLGKAFARVCAARGLPYRLLARNQMDIACPEMVQKAFEEHQPWAVINAAGFVKVDEAEICQEQCLRENVQGPGYLSRACAGFKIPLVTFSSDLVFDGNKCEAYLEKDGTNPLSVYGKSKAKAEEVVFSSHQDALVIRTSSFFGPWDEFSFVAEALRTLRKGLPFFAASDLKVSPTYIPDLVLVTLDLLMDGEKGIWHLTNSGEISWSEFASEVARRLKMNLSLIVSKPACELGLLAPRPAYSVLKSERGTLLPNLDHAITRFVEECNEARSLR